MKYFFVLLLFNIFLCSCNNVCRTNLDTEKTFIETLTQKDTLDVINLSSLCLKILNSDIDSAMNYIYYIKNDTLLPLTEAKRSFLKGTFLSKPIKEFKLDTLIFNSECDNILKYNVTFDNGNANFISQRFTFNPIKIESAWYLTLKE